MKTSLVVGIKNRTSHFLQTFPFMISQIGQDYELVIVDFHSEDELLQLFQKECRLRKDTVSKNLKEIKYVKVNENLKYNPNKVKNLGAKISSGEKIAFTDADVFLSMDYLSFWSNKVKEKKTFLATRFQETRVSLAKRISPEINYGNIIVSSKDFYEIGGWNESMVKWGGDDDDLCHRLKLYGLREINPTDPQDSRHYSILHGDDLRLAELEVPEKHNADPELGETIFQRVFSNTNFLNNNNCFFKYKNYNITTINFN
jgi:predicted glycosyltransferase involved in capsule biosynthesis